MICSEIAPRRAGPGGTAGPLARHAGLSIDLDAVEDYACFFGVKAEREPADRLYRECIERVIALAAEEGVKFTCFAIGRDAADPVRGRLIRDLAAAGHEIGNHSFSHHASLDNAGMAGDIERSHRVISELVGSRIDGYRSPAYWLADAAYRRIRELGYAYDSSAYPALTNIPFKLAAAALSRREVPLPVRFCAYGRLANIRAPRNPYHPDPERYWKPGPPGGFVEVPLTILPWLHWPFQFPYLLGWREPMIEFVFNRLLGGSFVNFSFHLIDFAGDRAAAWLRAIPALKYPYARREQRARFLIRLLKRHRELVLLRQLPALMAAGNDSVRG